MIRLSLVDRGWRIGLMYLAGAGLAYLGAVWSERHLDEPVRGLAVIVLLSALILTCHLLGATRLELLPDGVSLRMSGLLVGPTYLPYSRLARVQVVNNLETGLMLLVQERDGTVIEIGPWAPWWRGRSVRLLEEIRKEIAAGVERAAG